MKANKRSKQKARKTTKRKARSAASIGNGWITTDEEEVERRRLRAVEEQLTVKAIKTDKNQTGSIYEDYLVSRDAGGQYKVEYRDKYKRINSCDCPDFQVNGLGTCKHVERVSRFLLRKRKPVNRVRTEIFVNRQNAASVDILWADNLRSNSKVKKLLLPYFSVDNTLLLETPDSFKVLERAVYQSGISASVKISDHVLPWLKRRVRKQQIQIRRENYLNDIATGKRQQNFVKHALYDYQQDGMLHLAFTERAILADEMGLGKTVQAVAACELLKHLEGVERVLVVSPVSLKTEWEEQIAKFTGQDSLIIQGNRANRLKQYQKRSFFYLVNYEQILFDIEDIQAQIMPDVIILDEAQRIKNWQTKTAQAVKKLVSPYLFVLTGTPLENRIDEIYSLAQAVDPHLLGSLFRFNREFYQLDERGKPTGYKNLDVLHRKLRPILLRRRKHDVEDELPERIVNTYFVDMHAEQFTRYDEYKVKLARLLHKAKIRPLTPDEYKQIQIWLACMRMLCDTPYILDQDCRISPKLDELKNILPELLEDPDNKIIIFSEWTKMLDLIREHLDSDSIEYALHTGQVVQKKRRDEINRFKNDINCRLFLSSDAGATGLNLQAANIVINMDLPWNPAKLEQRIARAWRKHQTRQVNVINLVCESSIEHRIMSILVQKTALAEGVLEGSGEPDMELPSGRKVMIERLEQVMGGHTAVVVETEVDIEKQSMDAAESFHQEVEAKHPNMLDSLSVYENEEGQKTLLTVVRGEVNEQEKQLQDIADAQTDSVSTLEVIDAQTMVTIQRLIDAGILSMNDASQNILASHAREEDERARQLKWLEKARKRFSEVDRKFAMAELLFNGGFVQEAQVPVNAATELALSCLHQAISGKVEEITDESVIRTKLCPGFDLTEETVDLLMKSRADNEALLQQEIVLIKSFLADVDEKLIRYSL